MPQYIVNTEAQWDSKDHEVHDITTGACNRLPAEEKRKDLGSHSDCHGAVKEAKKTYTKVNGCYYCCEPCHTT